MEKKQAGDASLYRTDRTGGIAESLGADGKISRTERKVCKADKKSETDGG
ncbi:hypothetical protein IMSAGC013_01329 [Lachnospiraceae bacterium]|nr:hypothetical protein IMSAGC013_01329 [Lachnospiraceae bacterium]